MLLKPYYCTPVEVDIQAAKIHGKYYSYGYLRQQYCLGCKLCSTVISCLYKLSYQGSENIALLLTANIFMLFVFYHIVILAFRLKISCAILKNKCKIHARASVWSTRFLNFLHPDTKNYSISALIANKLYFCYKASNIG